MNIVNAIILVLLIIGISVGFHRGFLKESTYFFGEIIVVVVAFFLKSHLANLMYTYLPFFDFKYFLESSAIINILVYELIAFLIIVCILGILLKILIKVSGGIEGLLKATIILSIPSKILGAIVGFIESYFLVFIALVILTLQPFYQIKQLKTSEISNFIINKSVVLSNFVEKPVDCINELVELKKKYDNAYNREKFKEESVNIMLKYNIIDRRSVDLLIKKGKLKL